jgi:hypothetical protein
VLLLDSVLVVFVVSMKTSSWSIMSSSSFVSAVTEVCVLNAPRDQYIFSQIHTEQYQFTQQDKYYISPLSIHPSQLPNMPKGGTKRNDHHCPQRSHGNCRWVNKPVRHCATHTEMCTKHGLPHQTYQPCTKCDGEEAAAERELRKQKVSNNLPSICQDQEGQDKKSKGKKGKGKNKN